MPVPHVVPQVLFYLLRLESFTKMGRALQGGRFDHGDRLFHSVAATWQNCLDNTAGGLRRRRHVCMRVCACRVCL